LAPQYLTASAKLSKRCRKITEKLRTAQCVYAEVDFEIEIETIRIVLKEPLFKKLLLLFQHMMTLKT